MRTIKSFIFYNNTFPIALLFLFLSIGTAAAANEDVRESIASTLVEASDTVVSVDNSLLLQTDLAEFDTAFQVKDITEDDESFYVSYSFNTIEVVEGDWQVVEKKEVLQVNKEQLGERDLGLFVAKELAQVESQLRSHLREAQVIETTKGEAEKKVVRTYSGLIGRFLDTKDVSFDGYDPVVEPPPAPRPAPAIVLNSASTEDDVNVSNDGEEPDSQGDNESNDSLVEPDPATTTDSDNEDDTESPNDVSTTTQSSATTTSSTMGTVIDIAPPVITLSGSLLITLLVGDEYIEPGYTAIDDNDGDITAFVVVTNQIDSNTAGEYMVTYTVVDQQGNESTANRSVKVVNREQTESTTATTQVQTNDTQSTNTPDKSSTTDNGL